MSLIKMSLSGSMIILAIIIIRSLMIYKMPKRLLLVFWDMALIRLLIPFYIPTAFSADSVIRLFGRSLMGNVIGTDINTKMTNGNFPAERWQDTYTTDFLRIPGFNAADSVTGETWSGTIGIGTILNGSIGNLNIWDIVWIIGLVIVSVFFITAYIRWYREFGKSIPVRNEFVKGWLLEYKLKRPLDIRYSGRILTPLSYGIFKPIILMPKETDWEDEENLKYVLAHEYVHIRNFDALMKLLLIITVCVHWFNPFVWFMYILANRDVELSCDEAVIHMFGGKTRKAYAGMLVRMEEARNSFAPLTNSFSRNAIEVRIDAIRKMKNASVPASLFAAAIMICIMVLFSTSAQAANLTFPLSDLDSAYVQERLHAEGIDTDSNQYKAVISNMMRAVDEETAHTAYTNILAIKNQMNYYDEDGDFINPISGISGLVVTEENIDGKNRIIPIPENIREEMFELKRTEFILENGIANGDTTHRSDVYYHLYPQIEKDDRLAAGYTLQEYEKAYQMALVEAVKEINPTWEAGDEIPVNALSGITRESVESRLVQEENKLVLMPLEQGD